jgi:hypothetical protein
MHAGIRCPGFAGDGRDQEHRRTCEEQAGDCQTHGKRFAEPFDDSWWNRASLLGLRMAARDFVEWCQDLPEAALQLLDSELDVAGAPTLTAMRGRDRRQLLALLRRGRIQSEREWHMVNGCWLTQRIKRCLQSNASAPVNSCVNTKRCGDPNRRRNHLRKPGGVGTDFVPTRNSV